MNEMAVINFGDEKAYIEVEENAHFQNNGGRGKDGDLQIDASQMNQLVKVGRVILGELKQFEADEAEVSFGIKVGGEGSFFFAKANTEAQFSVKLVWKK